MKISVIIPAYNEEKRIALCLDSLKEQTRTPDEIIVVDNNSKDNTAGIAVTYGAKVLKETEQGIIPARNKGFDEAIGGILARTDADTTLPPDWLAKIEKSFAKDPNLVAVSGPAVFGSKAFSPIHNLFWFKSNKQLLGHPTLFGPNFAIRKSAWLLVRDEICHDDKKVHEDLDLAIHIANYGRVMLDPTLIVETSARRFTQPSQLFEYPERWRKTLFDHNIPRTKAKHLLQKYKVHL